MLRGKTLGVEEVQWLIVAPSILAKMDQESSSHGKKSKINETYIILIYRYPSASMSSIDSDVFTHYCANNNCFKLLGAIWNYSI